MIPRWAKRLFHMASIHDQAYRFMFRAGPPGEVVSIDCETTGLDTSKDDIITIAAVKIRDNRILASERFELIARPDAYMDPAAIKVHRLLKSDVEQARRLYDQMPALLNFIGGRPLVGYFLEFDMAMINKYLLPFAGIELPNPMIEVSALYYDRKYGKAPPGTAIDLSFARILEDLGFEMTNQHDAYADALMSAQIYLALRDMKRRGVFFAPPKRSTSDGLIVG